MGLQDKKITQDMFNYWSYIIPEYQFYSNYTLDSSFDGILTFSSTILSIGSASFSGILATTIVGQNVKYISSSAFSGSSSIINIDFPEVLLIDNTAFSRCSNLENINIPKVRRIGNQAFQLTKLTNKDILLPECISIGATAFSNAQLSSIFLPKIRRLESQTFQNCNKLTTITVGPNLISITTNIFQSCTSLATINVIGDENCLTAKTLATLTPAQLNNATIVYNYTPPTD